MYLIKVMLLLSLSHAIVFTIGYIVASQIIINELKGLLDDDDF